MWARGPNPPSYVLQTRYSKTRQADRDIVDVNNKAKLSLKGFSIRGPDGTKCDRLVAISVLGSAVLSFESSVIRGCIARGVQVGTAFGSHPQYGVATITKIDLVGYRDVGIFAIGKGSADNRYMTVILQRRMPQKLLVKQESNL